MICQELQPIPLRRLQDHSPKAIRILAPAQPAAELDLLVDENVAVLGHRTSRHDAIARGGLQAGHEIHAGRGQLGKPRHLEVATVEHQDRARREALLASHRRLSTFPLGDHEHRRQVPVVVQREMQFDGALRAPKGRPGEHLGAQLDDRRIQTQELVLKPKLLFGSDCRLTPGEQLVEDRLIQLPRPMLVRVAQRRPFRHGDPQMRETSFTARQASNDLAQRLRLPEVTEQHRDKLPPAGETARVALGFRRLDGALKLRTRKQLEQLAENAAKSHRGWPPVDGDGVWRLVPAIIPVRSTLFLLARVVSFRELIWTRVILNILGRRALSAGRLTGLGASP
jgi:hypothetical protein